MRPSRALLLSIGLGVGACGARGREPVTLPSTSAAAEARARIQLRRLDRRPSVLLLERAGDPRSALAVAVAHDLGAEASAGLGALLLSRLGTTSGVELRTHALGLELTMLAATPAQAATFVDAVDRALKTPVQPQDAALTGLPERLRTLRSRPLFGPADAAVLACSGEIGVSAGGATSFGARELEDARRRAATASGVGFGVVGPIDVLEATLGALQSADEWPTEPVPGDPWPERDVLGVSRSVDGPRRLSIALRVPEGADAMFAARALAPGHGLLSQRLAAFDPPWAVDRVVATARVRGGCLRLDLLAPSGDPGPDPDAIARAAVLTLDESRRVMAQAPEPAWILDDSVLRPSDPREAASIAAWRTLTGRQEAGPERQFLSYVTKPADPASDAELARAVERVRRSWTTPTVELVQRFEAGQGELWALLASPCGTIAESSDAGVSALVVRTLADKRSRASDVTLEPWITPDGVGLLAHAPRLGPNETATAQAERVGSALGHALVGTRLAGTDVAQARQALLAELGGPRPGWSQLLAALAPDRPAWLDARGTWQSLSSLVSQNVEVRQRTLGLGPLRLSVLSNSDPSQGAAVAGALERWLKAQRSETRACPDGARRPAQTGEQRVETDEDDAGISAYVGVALPATADRAPEWTAYLLNRPGGFLERALAAPGLVGAAEAIALGGSRAQALVIAVSTLPDRTDAAVAQIRGLLQRLAQGAVSEADLAAAQRRFEERDLEASLDPRRRVVDLWRGGKHKPPPDLAALRRFLRALQPSSHVVVRVVPQD